MCLEIVYKVNDLKQVVLFWVCITNFQINHSKSLSSLCFCNSIYALQIIIWLVIPATRNSRADHANSTLALFVLIQYVPRLFLIFPLNQRINKTTGVIAKTAWAGAAYNLILFMLASHVSN